eukprot:gene5887-4204_t
MLTDITSEVGSMLNFYLFLFLLFFLPPPQFEFGRRHKVYGMHPITKSAKRKEKRAKTTTPKIYTIFIFFFKEEEDKKKAQQTLKGSSSRRMQQLQGDAPARCRLSKLADGKKQQQQ